MGRASSVAFVGKEVALLDSTCQAERTGRLEGQFWARTLPARRGEVDSRFWFRNLDCPLGAEFSLQLSTAPTTRGMTTGLKLVIDGQSGSVLKPHHRTPSIGCGLKSFRETMPATAGASAAGICGLLRLAICLTPLTSK